MAHLLVPPSKSPTRLVSLGEGGGTVDRFLAEMKRFKTDSAELERVRRKAGDIVGSVPAGQDEQEIRSIFEWVRDSIRYTKDVRGVDTLQSPTVTLQLMRGDCDDKSLLLSAMLESIGYATRFVVAATMPNQSYNHVYVEVLQPRLGSWIPLEPSVSGFPFGRALRSFQPVRRYS